MEKFANLDWLRENLAAFCVVAALGCWLFAIGSFWIWHRLRDSAELQGRGPCKGL